jgi:transposase
LESKQTLKRAKKHASQVADDMSSDSDVDEKEAQQVLEELTHKDRTLDEAQQFLELKSEGELYEAQQVLRLMREKESREA